MIACWFYKKIIAQRVDASEPLPARTQQHLERCGACREFFELEREVARRLVADAPSHRVTPSPFLHAKIMASLDRRPAPAEMSLRWVNPLWATALIVAALALFSVWFFHGQHSNRQTAPPLVANNQPAIEQTDVTNASSPASQRLLELSTALDQPLQTEMQSMVSDARTALYLLAQNFLPNQDQR